jgi:DNA-binding phage protein
MPWPPPGRYGGVLEQRTNCQSAFDPLCLVDYLDSEEKVAVFLEACLASGDAEKTWIAKMLAREARKRFRTNGDAR